MNPARGLVGLPMYDLPVLRPATDALWTAIARHLQDCGSGDVPQALSRDIDPESLWTHPNLLLAQTCGLPLVTLLAGRVRFVAAPCYAAEGCADGDYCSWLVVRAGEGRRGIADLAGSIAAVNAPHSQSGANALAALTAPVAAGRPFFAGVRLTGAHVASLEAVRRGQADCAAIDCVTWALVADTNPATLSGLQPIAASPPVPALPFITSGANAPSTVAACRAALVAATRDPTAADACRTLRLRGIAPIDAAAYGRVRAMLETSLAQGCARLATLLRDLPHGA
jgi:ABC-type phosphate/phosphonate transport system substrate-binding protein